MRLWQCGATVNVGKLTRPTLLRCSKRRWHRGLHQHTELYCVDGCVPQQAFGNRWVSGPFGTGHFGIGRTSPSLWQRVLSWWKP